MATEDDARAANDEAAHSDSELVAAGLEAAFGRSPRPGESVLDAFERRDGRRPALLLASTVPLGRGGERAHTHYTFSDEIGRGGVGVA